MTPGARLARTTSHWVVTTEDGAWTAIRPATPGTRVAPAYRPSIQNWTASQGFRHPSQPSHGTMSKQQPRKWPLGRRCAHRKTSLIPASTPSPPVFLHPSPVPLLPPSSVGKSVVSALVGIALADGKLGDLETAVSDIVPELKGSGYEGVRLKDVLQMASGIRFNEDYADLFSDINRMGRALALGTSVQDFVRSLQRQFPPGTTNHYVSMDTQVLGLCLRRAVGMPLTQYLEEKLWVRCGMESDVRWSLDNEKDQMELAFGTLHATTRDYARFGWLYLNEGASPLDGRQVVPQEWVRASVTPDGPHVQPGPSNKQRAGIQHEPAFGYGYQWWLPGKLDHPDEVAGDFMAIGVYNQFIYVSPEHRVVVAMNCAYADYDKGSNELDSEAEAVEAFRAIARHFSVRECSSSS